MTAVQAAPDTAPSIADRELVMSREFDAPRDLVFQAWTDPAHLPMWFGPDGFSLTVHEVDIRPGGTWRFIMHGPDGRDYGNRVVYQEIVRPERLVYLHGEDVDDDPGAFHVTIQFEETDGRTRMTHRMPVQHRRTARGRDRVRRHRAGPADHGAPGRAPPDDVAAAGTAVRATAVRATGGRPCRESAGGSDYGVNLRHAAHPSPKIARGDTTMTSITGTLDSRTQARTPRRTARSIGAVLAGLVAIVALSTAADAGLHATGIYPPFPRADGGRGCLPWRRRTASRSGSWGAG